MDALIQTIPFQTQNFELHMSVFSIHAKSCVIEVYYPFQKYDLDLSIDEKVKSCLPYWKKIREKGIALATETTLWPEKYALTTP